MKLQNSRDIIKQILIVYPETRDNDNLLLFKVWEIEYRKLYSIFTSVKNLRDMLVSNKLSHFETIRRNRQYLQAKYPELRGSRYIDRKTIQVKETEEELGYIRTPDDAPGMKP